MNVARIAAQRRFAGHGHRHDRQSLCASGLEAIAIAAQRIMAAWPMY